MDTPPFNVVDFRAKNERVDPVVPPMPENKDIHWRVALCETTSPVDLHAREDAERGFGQFSPFYQCGL